MRGRPLLFLAARVYCRAEELVQIVLAREKLLLLRLPNQVCRLAKGRRLREECLSSRGCAALLAQLSSAGHLQVVGRRDTVSLLRLLLRLLQVALLLVVVLVGCDRRDHLVLGPRPPDRVCGRCRTLIERLVFDSQKRRRRGRRQRLLLAVRVRLEEVLRNKRPRRRASRRRREALLRPCRRRWRRRLLPARSSHLLERRRLADLCGENTFALLACQPSHITHCCDGAEKDEGGD